MAAMTGPTVITAEVRLKEERALAELAKPLNWGKWGPEDQLGSLNYVTAEKVVAARRLVKRGTVYPLAHVIRHQGGAPVFAGRPFPQLLFQYDGADWATGFGEGRRAAREATDDTWHIAIHGTNTHMDALCHYWVDHTMYNGNPGHLVNSLGAQRLGIENVRSILTRGVLLDMARYRGVKVMDGLDLITEEDIVGCCRMEGIEIETGDAVLFHTGWPALYYDDREQGYRYPPRFNAPMPGLGPSAILHLARKEICLVGADNGGVNWSGGGLPSGSQRDPRQGLGDEGSVDLHAALLRNLGLYLLELADLSEIARDAVYEFFLVIAPLPFKGASGSPLTPLAIV
jgi:kynurenine formamidase